MMAESNDTGALLISCGNETEIALGYATLYGDMCGGVSLIGDLSKLDVYRLARYVNTKHGAERIPEEAFHIKPSAELAANQFDPFDYWVVAPLVGELVERRTSPAALVALFEQRALDPARFVADADGRTVYDKHTAATFSARGLRLLPPAPPLRLQAAAGPADHRRHRTRVRIRSARNHHQWMGRVAIADCGLRIADLLIADCGSNC